MNCEQCQQPSQLTWPGGEVFWRTCKQCGLEKLVDMTDRSDWVVVPEHVR